VSNRRSFADALPDEALEASIRRGMDATEARLREAVKSDDAFITEAARHLVEAGGKRFRPMLVLLAAQFGDPEASGVVPSAVVVELTHLATLYHDDVMDEAPLRRGAPSANARWDNTVAILTGDFLFARASDILADLGPEAVRIQARTFERLVTGQIHETVGPVEGADPLAHYLDVVADKTGSLIATSGQLGAMMAGADDEVVDVLTRFGERIGVAFQLADDLLDVASESTESGKTPGTDLREGVLTLPGLHAMATTDDESAELRSLLSGPITDDALHARALEQLRSHPAMDSARAELQRWADDARVCLAPLPESTPQQKAAKQALSDICDAVIHRSA
jgi:heptaprenyl diphosphate synthase